MRGARPEPYPPGIRTGIIPACAGSTLTLAVSRSRARDHPRMCGEHPNVSLGISVRRGSSPHVRGAPVKKKDQSFTGGIIPACAGSTHWTAPALLARWDHPRMCGEHRGRGRRRGQEQGSSPHVRGALLRHLHFLDFTGIIPACAGSTRRLAAARRFHWDHPRMCGEHIDPDNPESAPMGSSPHVRGALWHRPQQGGAPGIIPACAGSTYIWV